MELGVSNFDKVKGLYNSVVFFMLVPRYLLFPQLFKERYLTVAIHLLCCFVGNLFVLTFYFPGSRIPPFYEAMFNPVMSFWMAVVLCIIEQAYPGYYKDLDRR